ncbi:TPA: hypothetical protein I7126_16530 [Vibrio vulnificus]|nr:hypothetical protein [Vibrio vulnificus]HAS6115849.1 hypothetical protein [Vibrio vulnificus]HAS6125234.1 hypothetical protein [Vibrio vulnificus]
MKRLKVIKYKIIKETEESIEVFNIIKKLDDEYSKEENLLFGGSLETNFIITDENYKAVLGVVMEGINPSVNFSQELKKAGFKYSEEINNCEIWTPDKFSIDHIATLLGVELKKENEK